MSDCRILLALWNNLEGSGPLNWSDSLVISQWDGVSVGGSPIRVTGLNLRFRQLTGELLGELGKLALLESLDLQDNRLSGSIPAEIGQLSNLVSLNLSENQLSGELAPELSGLKELKTLGLWGNRLEGSHSGLAGPDDQPGIADPLWQPFCRGVAP